MLISWISLRISSGTVGRPPRGRDFQRPVQTEARMVPFDYGPGPNNRKRIKNAREETIETNEHQSADSIEGLFLGGGSSQNNDLLPQR
jgi:hypothetical protein